MGRFLFFLLILVVSLGGVTPVWSRPTEVEIWFLALSENGKVLQFLEKSSRPGEKFVQSDDGYLHAKCQKFGDQYFHPQWGLHPHQPLSPLAGANEGTGGVMEKNIPSQKPAGEEGISIISNWESQIIQCDKNYHFDFFCGEARPQAALPAAAFEFWIDVSSSLSHADPPQGKGGTECFRKSFIRRLKGQCPDNSFIVGVFNTSLKTVSTEDSLCDQHGLNDQKRLIDWIEASPAKKLFIISDIYELSAPLTDYLHSIGADLKGDDPKKPLKGEDLLGLVDSMVPLCKK